MSKTYSDVLTLSLALLSLVSAAPGQQPEKKVPVSMPRTDCELDTCISKVLSLPNFSTAYELQDVTNMLGTIADITTIYPNLSDHTITLKSTPEKLALADKLVGVLEKLRSGGGHDRSSILVYEFKNSPERDVSEQAPGQCFVSGSRVTCEETTVKALYLPDLSSAQFSDVVNRIRSSAQITRTSPSPSNHVLFIRGTSQQVALAETVTNE